MTTRMPTDDQELSSTDPNRNRQNPRGRKDSAYKKSGQRTRRYRLIEQLKVKGFMTQNDHEKLYSTNGDQWQRDTIVFDHAQHWTGQKDRYGQMIFWGDLVTFRLPDGQMSPKQLILGSEGQTILACTETRRFQPIDEQHQEFELRYGQVVQQITNYPITLGDYNALRVAQIVRSETSIREALLALAVLLVGIALSAGAQMFFADEVGPISSIGGGLLALCWLSLRQKRNRQRLTRKWVFALAKRTALIGILIALFALGTEGDSVTARSVVAYALTGFLIPGTLVVLTGDMVSWVTGGYDGELSKAVATLVQSGARTRR